jgi:hypothetical protein
MAKHTVNVERLGNRLSLHFEGPLVAKANQQQLTSCVTALLECADQNQCFEKGLSAACLGTIAKHDAETQCVSKGFGFGGR